MQDASRIMKPTPRIRTKKLLTTTLPERTEFSYEEGIELQGRNNTHTPTRTCLRNFAERGGGGGDDEKCTLTENPDFYSQSALVKNQVYNALHSCLV
jgi:hypothetical protein